MAVIDAWPQVRLTFKICHNDHSRPRKNRRTSADRARNRTTMDIILQIKVTPRAKASSLTQASDGSWVAKLKSPPVDGKANEELIALVAEHFGCHKKAVSIKTGESSRIKRVVVKS